MAKYTKVNGKYVINGHRYETLEGTRAQVWHGTAYKTSGGLKKDDLMQNKGGRIVSKSKYQTAKKEMRLLKAGYGTKKGKFGYVKLSSRTGKGKKSKSRSRSKAMRGGSGMKSLSNMAEVSGMGMPTTSPQDRALGASI